jgi:hypothetical protein
MKRYDPETVCLECGADVHMIEMKQGEYVEYDEYEKNERRWLSIVGKLQVELNRLREDGS